MQDTANYDLAIRTFAVVSKRVNPSLSIPLLMTVIYPYSCRKACGTFRGKPNPCPSDGSKLKNIRG
jgi:hypothetical protein